jgi:hypothetical protein
MPSHSENPKENQEVNPDEKTLVALAAEEIAREKNDSLEKEPKKKCCSYLSKDARWCFHCCIKTWSCTLNTCECCCGGLSACCIFSSGLANSFRNCLEEIDCDERK